jgi:hypothetical protein
MVRLIGAKLKIPLILLRYMLVILMGLISYSLKIIFLIHRF